MYRSILVFVMLVSMSGANVHSSPSTKTKVIQDRSWHAGTFRGLTIGKSTRADMLRVFGTPQYSGPSADQDETQPIVWNDYVLIAGELSGQLAVEVDNRSGIIVGISVSPEHMSKIEAIAHFGKDYRLVSYASCPGIGENEETGPVYESPDKSQINYVEYREKGIAIHLSGEGNVNAIYFLSEPIGLPTKEGCKKALEKLVKESKRG